MTAGRAVTFKFDLGDKARSIHSDLHGTVTGFCVWADGATGCAVTYLDANGVERTDWHHESLCERVST